MFLNAAKKLGCIDAAASLDVTDKNSIYSHERMYETNLLAIASGKQRLSHVDELISEEFKVACGGNYPRKSTNHAYLDKIVARDQELIENGKESIVQEFKDNTAKGYINAGILDGDNIYIDKHVIEVRTDKNIAKDQHAIRNTVVKAINEYRIICANTKTTIVSSFYNAGKSFSTLLKPALEKVKSLTGKPVKLLGVDKGAYNVKKLMDAVEKSSTCIAIWSKDTAKTLESLAAIDEGCFETYETEVVKDAEGNEREVVKTSIADAGEIVIDKDGHKVHAVAIKNNETGRRIGILVFGSKASKYDKHYIADFMYGKQNIENSFKEHIKYGGDRFCGGVFKKAEIIPLSEEELLKNQKRIVSLPNRIAGLNQDIERYDKLLSEGQLSKRDYNRLSKKSQKNMERLSRVLDDLKAKSDNSGREVVNEKERHELDTRKMAILAGIQDHVVTCRMYILNIFVRIIADLLSEKLSKRGLGTDAIEEKVQKRLKGLNMQKISTRLFGQGGYVYKDDSADKYVVVMKNYETSLMQEAFEKLYNELNNIDVQIESGRKKYSLVFLSEDAFRKKYTEGKNLDVRVAV